MGRQTTRKPLSTQSQSRSTISRQPAAWAPPEYRSEHHKSPMAIRASPASETSETSGSAVLSQGGTPCSCNQVFNDREGKLAPNRIRSPPCLVDTLISGQEASVVVLCEAGTSRRVHHPHFII